MFHSSRLILAFLSVAAALAAGAAAPVAEQAGPRSHYVKHAPVPSTLPPPHLIGDPATRLSRVYGGTKTDVLTYHYDLNRTGWNPTETDLNTTNVANPNQFGLIATLQVDGNVLAQPLLVSNYQISPTKTRDLLIIATGNDSVYAFDAQTYELVWKVSMGTAQSSDDVGCSDIIPSYGITGTPVIIRTGAGTGTIYLVAATEPSPGVFVSTLHSLRLTDGKDRVPPVVISPSAKLSDGSTIAFDPQNQWNRPGLVYASNSIYVALGSHCDNDSGAISGWLVRYNTNLAYLSAFHTIETHGGTELASIWMSGFAPSVGAKGNLFFATGNGNFTKNQMDWGESVLRVTANLATVGEWFTVNNYAAATADDEDLGSGGVLLLPQVSGQTAPPMAVQVGKTGVIYLLNQNSLGGLHPNDSGALQVIGPYGGTWGGPAYYDGPAGPTVFTQGDSGYLRGWSVTTSTPPSMSNRVSGTSEAGMGGSIPIVSSNGATPNTGLVWLVNRLQEPFSVEGYDAYNLGAPLFSAQVGTWSNAGAQNPFLTAMEANGRVYVPGYKLVQVYGLLP